MSIHPLLQSFRTYADFSDESFQKYLTLTVSFQVKKNELIYEAGTVPKYSPFIVRGCVRQYIISEEGEEKTIELIEEGTWAGQIGAMRSKVPTNINLQALEDCDIVGITIENADHAMEIIPAYRQYFFSKYTKDHARLMEEAHYINTASPEELYIWLMNKKPTLLNRVPQQYIASYLGIRPETLSRIRNKISRQ